MKIFTEYYTLWRITSCIDIVQSRDVCYSSSFQPTGQNQIEGPFGSRWEGGGRGQGAGMGFWLFSAMFSSNTVIPLKLLFPEYSYQRVILKHAEHVDA